MNVLVVGAGPAGISAALHARELGGDVTLLEADSAGGTSLNRGPAPVRTLARAARLMRDWSSWESFGLEGGPPRPNLEAVLANSSRVARHAQDKKDISGHIRLQGIELAEGIGPVSFVDSHTMRAGDGRRWSADSVILAVGGKPAVPPVPGNELAVTYSDIRSLFALPARVAVVGGSDTGCQIASIFADFGAEVALFEAGPRLVPTADESVSSYLCGAFQRRGMAVHLETFVEELQARADAIRVSYRKGTATSFVDAGAVFFAVGWLGNIDGLGLESAGVSTRRHAIPVDDCLRTNVGHIFAVGDVNRRSMLVQSARLEGRVAAHNAINGSEQRMSYDVVPSASFTDPEYGKVGLTEAEADKDAEIVVGVAQYHDLLRPVADGRPEGFCKLIVDANQHTVLGGHVIGEYSAEIVQMVAACMAAGMRVEQIAELQLAFPTFTEGVTMAAQKICRTLGVGNFPQVWSYLGEE